MKYFWIGLILSAAVFLHSQPQDLITAGRIADNFLQIMEKDNQIIDIQAVQDNSSDRSTLCYLMNLDPAGFIIVSARSELYPVMAYSFRESITGTDNPLLDILIHDLKLRLEYYRKNPEAAEVNRISWQQWLNDTPANFREFEQWPVANSTLTDGWVLTTWNQSGVYNRFCPIDNTGERSVVGCTATALAMIMDFHSYIGAAQFTDADDYQTWTQHIHIDNDHEARDFPSFPELNFYLQELTGRYEAGLPLIDDDKPAISFAAGVAVHMNYSSTGSGAWGVEEALEGKFGYESVVEIDGDNYQFFSRLIANMQEMRPVEMSIYSESSGHAIIVDGYNTNNYFHLNYGWGTSNNTCWYLLPQGMPSGYSVIGSGIMDIEGGELPVAVSGDINAEASSLVGAEVFLDGEVYDYHCYVNEEDGGFWLPAVKSGYYTATAFLSERIYYQQLENILIDADNDFLQFDLGNFEAVTGVVTAPVEVNNCLITLYQNGEIVHTGYSGDNGFFSLPDVLPGYYRATASMTGNYFDERLVEITLENQTIDFTLTSYPFDIALGYASSPVGTWSLAPNYEVSCAIRIGAEESSTASGDLITKVRFKAPFSAGEGNLFAQVWLEETLISEVEVTGFNMGEWVTQELNNYVRIEPGYEYFAGYRVAAENGVLAFHDEGPRVSQKGAWIRHSYWLELQPVNFNFNFNIEAVTSTQEAGLLSGNVTLEGGNGILLDAVVDAGNFVTHPDLYGNYHLGVKYGTYDLTASLNNYQSQQIPGLTVDELNPALADLNFVLIMDTFAGESDLPLLPVLINYPNPFNPRTTIFFNLPALEERDDPRLEIFNSRGQ
ncbi:MAG: C10 family peptidase, partial [Candidatus Cloacimonetes bacterium]|nr:C10 family peptidase [Candidatus Cloacimonadota bacterium]